MNCENSITDARGEVEGFHFCFIFLFVCFFDLLLLFV